MLRPLLLCGLAAALLSAPAMADTMVRRPSPQLGAGFAAGAFGLTSTNVGTATNTAAGIGNTARQRVVGVQSGSPGGPGMPFGPLVSTNVGVATNTAAGIGNSANQRVLGMQGNGVQVGLNMTGRGPLVSTDVDLATNVAAGLGNSARQKAIGVR
ncbi:hypothetical protein [Azospirillum sp. TSO35-2]|uniref:hypothetical protein n=1 Tax=Azospirillum sp. TSO35-2 TaxID=716796 RepID=UPI000D61F3CE|nr:hypothetical protein [Azospirillum sp. TSO35-2]PWC37784.1 hypothetical protein TSO352_09910 [Azospirillum sp. TSO35-2]